MFTVFIGLGSNLGNRRNYLETAVVWLKNHPDIQFVQCTPFIETEPWGVTDQPGFLNGIAQIKTTLTGHQLLAELQKAEKKIGRKDGREKWGPREIDLDILLYGQQIIDSETLVVPHPELTNRLFILEQLLALQPTLRHPVSHKYFSSFVDSLKKHHK